MSNNRLIVRLLAPLAVALFVVAISIGLAQTTLVDTTNGSVVCANAFGTADISGATETGQASCAALTSERQMWSYTLLGTSLGLLFGVFWVALSTSHRREDAQPTTGLPTTPAPATQWVDYPAAGPVQAAAPVEANPAADIPAEPEKRD